MENLQDAASSPRYGWVFDQGTCIGCHACTVACKAENDVVLGGFRTWVKWIEHGEFPEVSRSAAILRCNHCSDAPCMKICPTSALFQHENGIVDLDRDRCIGCASCMQACPYDAIHMDDRSGTAAKCHFCAHRLEVDLAPACVAVCPEQAIKVADLDDPATRAELESIEAQVRKADRGTEPNAYYLRADPLVLAPLAVDATRTLSHAEVPDPLPAPGTAEARAVYDIPRARLWGKPITAYMVTKALAAGSLLGASLSTWLPTLDATLLGRLSILFTAITLVLLVVDLHKPSRFLYVLLKSNPQSWLVRGGWILTAHLALSLPWALGFSGLGWSIAGIPIAFMTSIYTAFLFRQARGRELWCEDRLLHLVLGAQTVAALAVVARFHDGAALVGIGAYVLVTLASIFVPPTTEHARQGHHLMVRKKAFKVGVVAAFAALAWPPLVILAFALLDHAYIEAGQEVPLS